MRRRDFWATEGAAGYGGGFAIATGIEVAWHVLLNRGVVHHVGMY